VVIVLSLDNDSMNCMMGFVVDAVSDVLNVEEGDMKKAPNFGGTLPADMVEGLVNVGDNVVTIISTEQLLTLEDD